VQELGTKKKETPAMPSGVDWYNLLVLILATIAISGIVTLYVLSLAWLNLKRADSDPLERAANLAAADLIRVNVVSRSFGTLGLADFINNDSSFTPGHDGASRDVRSFNTVASLIRTSLFVAKRYDLKIMGEQAAGDMHELQELQDELHKKLIAAIKEDGSGKIYEHIKRCLANGSRGGEHLESLHVKLGKVKGKLSMSLIAAEPEDDPACCQSGRLKALTPLVVPYSDEKFILHQQSKIREVFNPDDFVADDQSMDSPIPAVILIEAQFSTRNDKNDKGDKRGLVTSERRICTVATSAAADNKVQQLFEAPMEGCLALSFPQGKPNTFNSLESVLKYKDWQGQGSWQQAVRGPVPGAGQLAPPTAPHLQEMNGSDSLSIAFYHWIRQLTRPIAPARLATVLKAQWPHPSALREPSKAATAIGDNDGRQGDLSDASDDFAALQINSGLLKDSDARPYALLYQNKPTEAGQKALMRCFQALPSKFPASALPVVVDSVGRANLPGRQGFDQKLAFDLLNHIYATNLAAQDSQAAAKLIQSSALRAYRSSRERLFLAQSDLDSLSARLRVLTDSENNSENDSEENKKEIKTLHDEIDWRNNRIAYENNEQKKQLKAISLSQVAIVNATAVAAQSFECGSKLFQLCRAGINRIDNLNNKTAYLLGKRFIFCPLTQSLQENDIFAEAASPWLAKKMVIFGAVRQVTDMPATQLMVEGRSLSDLLAETSPSRKAEPAVIVYTPKILASTSIQGPLYFREYPFRGLPVAESQLIYYCQNAYTSGTGAGDAAGSVDGAVDKSNSAAASQKVAWSILARDLVVNREINAAHQRLGLPLAPAAPGWCKHALPESESRQLDTIMQSANSQYANIQTLEGQSISNQAAGGTALSQDDESCPGLAAEWQLRSPVLFINDKQSGDIKGTTLSDPESGQRVQQIPPVGPDLM